MFIVESGSVEEVFINPENGEMNTIRKMKVNLKILEFEDSNSQGLSLAGTPLSQKKKGPSQRSVAISPVFSKLKEMTSLASSKNPQRTL